jgi:hypothetical protein
MTIFPTDGTSTGPTAAAYTVPEKRKSAGTAWLLSSLLLVIIGQIAFLLKTQT